MHWLVIGALLWPVEQLSERMEVLALSVVFTLGLIYVVMHLLLAMICWGTYGAAGSVAAATEAA